MRSGEVNRAREVHWCASGKVLNAAVALHLLGGPSMTLAPVGGLNLVHIEREFKGKNGDRDVTIRLERKSPTTTKVEVTARKNMAEWDKDYAREVLSGIVKKG